MPLVDCLATVMTHTSDGYRLEQYTIQHPEEVLLVQINIAGEVDQVAIFKGYSSSLTRSTAFDPDVPVIPDTATIVTIDRVESPYDPESPCFIQRGLLWEDFLPLLVASGI